MSTLSNIVNRKSLHTDWSTFDLTEEKVLIETNINSETVESFSSEEDDRLYTIIKLFPDLISKLYNFYRIWVSERPNCEKLHFYFTLYIRVINNLVLDKKLYVKSPIKFGTDHGAIKNFAQEKYSGKSVTPIIEELILKLEVIRLSELE